MDDNDLSKGKFDLQKNHTQFNQFDLLDLETKHDCIWTDNGGTNCEFDKQ